MYKSFFISLLLSVSVVSSVYGGDNDQNDPRNPSVQQRGQKKVVQSPSAKLPFVQQQTQDENTHLKQQQELAFAKGLYEDMGKEKQLTPIKDQFKGTQMALSRCQKKLGDFEKEEQTLEAQLQIEPNHQQFLARQEFVKIEIKKYQNMVMNLQEDVRKLEQTLEDTQQGVIRDLKKYLHKELLEKTTQVKSIEETGDYLAFPSPGVQARLATIITPCDIIKHIVQHAIQYEDALGYRYSFKQSLEFSLLLDWRLISKRWKPAIDNVIKLFLDYEGLNFTPKIFIPISLGERQMDTQQELVSSAIKNLFSGETKLKRKLGYGVGSIANLISLE